MGEEKLPDFRCPLCGAAGIRPDRLGLLACTRCGLLVLPTIWQSQANETLVEEWFGETYRPQTSFWVRWFEAWNNRRTLRRLAGVKLSGHRLLV